MYIYICVCVRCSVVSNSLWPMDCSPPGSSVHGIPQATILEWVALPFSRAAFRPRDQTQVSCIAGRFFTVWATRAAHIFLSVIYSFMVVLGLHCSTWALCCCAQIFSSCSEQPSHGGAQAPGHAGFRSCSLSALRGGSVVVTHGLSCPAACGIPVPRLGIEPMSPALAGRFLTTGPPGKSLFIYVF